MQKTMGSQLSARVSDISATGCYVDTINPLPSDTAVRVKIINDARSFEASATVAYSLTHLGMVSVLASCPQVRATPCGCGYPK